MAEAKAPRFPPAGTEEPAFCRPQAPDGVGRTAERLRAAAPAGPRRPGRAEACRGVPGAGTQEDARRLFGPDYEFAVTQCARRGA